MLANSAVGGVAHHTKKLISDSLTQPVAVHYEALWASFNVDISKKTFERPFRTAIMDNGSMVFFDAFALEETQDFLIICCNSLNF